MAATRKGSKSRPQFFALIGLRGAGKSTVGPMLARRLKTEFVEVDKLVEKAAGMSLGEIFATHGEAYYRDWNESPYSGCSPARSGCVLVPGGSVVTDAETWSDKTALLHSLLHATPEEFMKRMRRQATSARCRAAVGEWRVKDIAGATRGALCRSDLKIRTPNKSPTAVVGQIIKAVRARRT